MDSWKSNQSSWQEGLIGDRGPFLTGMSPQHTALGLQSGDGIGAYVTQPNCSRFRNTKQGKIKDARVFINKEVKEDIIFTHTGNHPNLLDTKAKWSLED